MEVNGFDDKIISDIKLARDFNGELFVVVECEPTGYLIYDNKYESLLEFAASSVSPYKGISENLIYGGPTYYYQQSKLRSTASEFYMNDLIAEEPIAIDVVIFDAFKEYNGKNLMAAKEQFIKNSEFFSLAQEKTDRHESGVLNGSRIISGDWITVSIDNSSYISGMTQFGTNKNGTCGYIAAGIVLYYAFKQYSNAFISSEFVIDGGVTNALHLALVQIGANLGIGNGTYAEQIYRVMQTYCTTRVPQATHYWMLASTTPNIDFCMLNNKPVIIFGNLVDVSNPRQKINHAVTVFGRSDYSPIFRISTKYFNVHYGWEGYTNVSILDSIFANPVGSMYNLNPQG